MFLGQRLPQSCVPRRRWRGGPPGFGGKGRPVAVVSARGHMLVKQVESGWGPGIRRGIKCSMKTGEGWAGRGAAGGTENQEESRLGQGRGGWELPARRRCSDPSTGPGWLGGDGRPGTEQLPGMWRGSGVSPSRGHPPQQRDRPWGAPGTPGPALPGP